jgi:phenylalanyl-tRNA synthetase beta chain
LRRRAEDGLRDLGFDQVVGWSFTDPGEPDRLRIPEDDPQAKPILLANPLSEDQSAMRTLLLGSLLDIAARNTARGIANLALFEAGAVYSNQPPAEGEFVGRQAAPFAEPSRIGAIAIGSPTERSWRGGDEAADFFGLKGVLEALVVQLGAEASFAPTEEPFLHPGRSAAVSVGGTAVGWLGEVHPLVCRTWDIEAAVAFELDLAPLLAAATVGEERYEAITVFPPVREDLAMVVPEEVPAAKVREVLLIGGSPHCSKAEVFDVFQGEQVGEGRKSLTFGVEFSAPDRTLTEDEVAPLRKSILRALDEIGGSLRG